MKSTIPLPLTLKGSTWACARPGARAAARAQRMSVAIVRLFMGTPDSGMETGTMVVRARRRNRTDEQPRRRGHRPSSAGRGVGCRHLDAHRRPKFAELTA